MKRFLMIALLIGAANSAGADDKVQGKRLVLMNALSSPSQVGDLVQLQDPNNCRYIGKLEHRGGEAESFWARLLNQSGGNVGSWSIAVDRQVCGAIETPVALTIPLRNVVSKDDYKPGDAVLAYPSK